MLIQTLYLLSVALTFIFPFLTVLLLDVTNGDRFVVGIISSAGFLASAIAQKIFGNWMDHGQGVRTLFVGAVFLSLGFSGLLAYHESPLILGLSVAAFMVGNGAIVTCTGLIVEGLAEESKRGRVASLFALLSNFGQGISSVLAFFFLATHRMELLFADWITTLLLTWSILPHLVRRDRYGTTTKTKIAAQVNKPSISIFELAAVLAIYLTLVAHLTAIPFLFAQRSLPVKELTTIMFAVGCLVVVLVSGALMKYGDRFSDTIKWWSCASLLGVGHAVMPIANSKIAVALATAVWATGEALSYPLITKAVYRMYGENAKGSAASMKTILLRISLIFGPLLAYLVNETPPFVFSLVYGLLPIAGTTTLLWLLKRKSQC